MPSMRAGRAIGSSQAFGDRAGDLLAFRAPALLIAASLQIASHCSTVISSLMVNPFIDVAAEASLPRRITLHFVHSFALSPQSLGGQ